MIFRKRKEKECSCGSCCQTGSVSAPESEAVTAGEIRTVAVYGSGCRSCHTLFERAKEAVEKLELPVTVEYISDFEKMCNAGIMSVPALAVNGTVVSAGKVLSTDEIIRILR